MTACSASAFATCATNCPARAAVIAAACAAAARDVADARAEEIAAPWAAAIPGAAAAKAAATVTSTWFCAPNDLTDGNGEIVRLDVIQDVAHERIGNHVRTLGGQERTRCIKVMSRSVTAVAGVRGEAAGTRPPLLSGRNWPTSADSLFAS